MKKITKLEKYVGKNFTLFMNGNDGYAAIYPTGQEENEATYKEVSYKAAENFVDSYEFAEVRWVDRDIVEYDLLDAQ